MHNLLEKLSNSEFEDVGKLGNQAWVPKGLIFS